MSGVSDEVRAMLAQAGVRPELEFVPIAQLCAEVDAAGPRTFLLRRLWPAGDYGVHAAEMKAQKTWNTADLAVSVASGTDWLGAIGVDTAGPVIMLAGEGGKGSVVRRLRAVCEHRGLKLETLPITVCTRAPRLSRSEHLYLVEQAVREFEPCLVTLDPLYLSAGGANGASLYEMGTVLGKVQQICEPAALWVVTHFNRREGSGALRITGAGPAEWGRVLVSATVLSRHTDIAAGKTTVLTRLDVIGGEVPDQSLRVLRVIWADDPDDLDSPLHYQVTVEAADPAERELAASGDAAGRKMPPAERKLLEALEALEAGEFAPASRLVDWIAAKYGHGLTRQTYSMHLNDLAARGLADFAEQGAKQEKLWCRHVSATRRDDSDDASLVSSSPYREDDADDTNDVTTSSQSVTPPSWSPTIITGGAAG
jgi:hypothetical protein